MNATPDVITHGTARIGAALGDRAIDDVLFNPIDRGRLRNVVRARVFGETEPVRVGRYRVTGRLGEGAMGVVYEARDERLDRKLALKLVHTARGDSDGNAHHRLVREAQVLARLSHPNVVQVHDVGQWDGQVFIAMEYVQGQTLRAWQDDEQPSWSEVVRVYRDAARGLAAAHAVGIVHRDFKPDNVLLGTDGRVRVADFGLAQADGRREDSGARATDVALTRTGAVMGTPAYMAPEQLLGHDWDERADQFALGVALFEALHGVRPFSGDTVTQLASSIESGATHTRAGEVPGWLRTVVYRMLRMAPDERYPNMGAVVAALTPRRRRRWVAGFALSLAAAASVGAFLQRATADPPIVMTASAPAPGEGSDPWQRRADEMTLAAAAEALEHDPTRAVALLRGLSPDGWAGGARLIAADARRRGIASKVIRLPAGGRSSVSPRAAVIQWDELEGGRSEVLRLADGERFALRGRFFSLPRSGRAVLTVDGLGEFGLFDVAAGRERNALETSLSRPGTSSFGTSEDDRYFYRHDDRGMLLLGLDRPYRKLVDIKPLTKVSVGGGTEPLVAGIDNANALALWDAEAGATRVLGQGYERAAFDHRGAGLAAWGRGGLHHWPDPRASESSHHLAGHPIRAVVWLHSSNEVVGYDAYHEEAVTIDFENGRVSSLIGLADDPEIAFSPSHDGLRIAVRTKEGVRVVDRGTGRHVKLPLTKSRLSLAWSETDDGLWAATQDQGLRFFPAPSFGRDFGKIHADATAAVAFITDTRVVTGGWDGAIREVDLDTGAVTDRGRHPEGSIHAIAADGDLVVTAGEDETLRLWRGGTDAEIIARGTPDDARALAMDGRIVVWLAGEQLRRYDLATAKELPSLPCPGCMRVQLPSQSDLLVAAPVRRDGEGFAVRIWDRSTQRARDIELGDGPIIDAATDPTGRILAFVSGRTVHVRVIDSGSRWQIPGGDLDVAAHWMPLIAGPAQTMVGVTAHGQVLVTDEEGSPAWWDPSSRLHRPAGHLGLSASMTVVLSPDGTRAVGGTSDGTIIQWRDDLPHDPARLARWVDEVTDLKVEGVGTP